jgi:hypothetical protein
MLGTKQNFYKYIGEFQNINCKSEREINGVLRTDKEFTEKLTFFHA